MEDIYKNISTRDLEEWLKIEPSIFIFEIGVYIDSSIEYKNFDSLDLILQIIENYDKEKLSSDEETLLFYFISNVWSNKKLLTQINNPFHWQINFIDKEILYLRKAIESKGFLHLEPIRKSQIYTNLGNCFSTIGRSIEAIDLWDRSIKINSNHGMTRNNRAYGIFYYANYLYDDSHKSLLLKYAYKEFSKFIDDNRVHENAKRTFASCNEKIKKMLKPEYLESDFNLREYSLGKTLGEKNYRNWVLKNKLFLNPMNDVFFNTAVAQDIFNLPSLVTEIDDNPYHLIGFYNQLKQEYVFARYQLYEGLTRKRTHFCDRKVYLYNTLDYPIYGINIENVKSAFRIIYSLFDKISFFINEYFNLKVKKPYFRGIWYHKEKYENELKECFQDIQNIPLRALFWLSKDLQDREEILPLLDPNSRKVAIIRNHIEHKYIKIHEYDVETLGSRLYPDKLAFSIQREEFEERTLNLLKLGRASLIYLSLAIHQEEIEKRDKNKTVPMYMDRYDDSWKI